MNRIHGKRLQFDRDEDGWYIASFGPHASAFLMQDQLGWRGLLSNDMWDNPIGVFLTPLWWRHDCLHRAVCDFEAMISDSGYPIMRNRTGDRKPFWYGEPNVLSGPFLNGDGEWFKQGRNVVTFPVLKGKRKAAAVPPIVDAWWDPVIAQIEIYNQAVAFDVEELQRASREGEEPQSNIVTAELLLAGLLAMQDCDCAGGTYPAVALPIKDRTERMLFKLAKAVDRAKELHFDGCDSGIMFPRVAAWVQQGVQTGQVTIDP